MINATAGSIEIRAIKTRAERRRFLTFPWKVYADDPLWVPPLIPERMKVTERWVAAAGERLVVLAHVGHNSLPAARALAAHAGRTGARGIAAFAPSYSRPGNADELTAFCGEIASAAPDLPFYYYHIPSMTGVHLPVYDFFRAASGRIENLAGAKYTHEDLMDFGRCLRLDGGRFDCNGLEAPLQCRVRFDVPAVLLQRGRADTL